MSRFEPQLLGRVGRYGRQVPHPGDEVDRDERLERLQARDEDGPFPAATSEDILGEVEQDDPVEQGINAMILTSTARAREQVEAAQMTREQRTAVALADELDRRAAAKAEPEPEEPDWAAEAEAQLAAEDERAREADESIAEITSQWEADRREQEAAAAEQDEDDWLYEDEDERY